jgi:hypothetical protein
MSNIDAFKRTNQKVRCTYNDDQGRRKTEERFVYTGEYNGRKGARIYLGKAGNGRELFFKAVDLSDRDSLINAFRLISPFPVQDVEVIDAKNNDLTS